MIDIDASGTINFTEFLSLISGRVQEKDQEADLKTGV